MTTKYKSLLLVIVLLFGVVQAANAELFRVGPNDVPSPPGNGFPFWYQDNNGLVLDLCVPANQTQLDAGVCLILPTAQDPATGVDLPFVFPTNYPDELFWWAADSIIDIDANNQALLVLALEAAFAGGGPAVNDQISFGRVRIRVDAPVNGNYTITYPFGERVFPNVTAGGRAINFTDDIGIGAPGDFTGALQSAIGPFLLAADAPGGNPLPFVTVPGDLSGDQFLSDAVTPVFVTGSIFDDPQSPGTRANFFRVCVDTPGGLDGLGTQCVTSDVFILVGKVHQGAIGSPLTIERATYARNAAGTSAQVDVYASASPSPGAATPVLSLGDAGGTTMPSVQMRGPTTLGEYYGQGLPTVADTLPAAIIVTNEADVPPSSVTRGLVDEVSILSAIYNPDTGTISITATSSDKLVPPQLSAIGLPEDADGSELLPAPLVPGADPAERQLVDFPIGDVPPVTVTVQSSAGGMDSEFVTTFVAAALPPGAPVAVDDNVSVPVGTTPVLINVLQNDTGFDATTVLIVSAPTNGTAIADAVTGQVTYTPTNLAFVGDDTFTYTVRSAPAPGGQVSNVATVTVTTTAAPPGGAAPIANPDGPFQVQANAALQINVAALLANDDPNGGTIDAASFQIVPGSATGGSATGPVGGVVTYTAGPNQGSFGFSYTVANTAGDRSGAALVSITVLPGGDTLTITRAEFRTVTREWRIDGTGSVPGNTITIRNGGPNGPVLGSAVVDALGAWVFRERPSSALPTGNPANVAAISNGGGTASANVLVRR